jgi:hypothetical protein
MVLNSIYHFPMIFGYPMMFEYIRFILWVNHDLGWYDCIFYLLCYPVVPSVSCKRRDPRYRVLQYVHGLLIVGVAGVTAA